MAQHRQAMKREAVNIDGTCQMLNKLATAASGNNNYRRCLFAKLIGGRRRKATDEFPNSPQLADKQSRSHGSFGISARHGGQFGWLFIDMQQR